MNPTRLRLALFGLIATLQLSALVIIVSGAHDNLQTQGVNARDALLLELSEAVTEQINQFLQPAQTQLSSAHRLIENGFLVTDDNPQLARFFRAQLETNPWLRGMFIGRADGSFIATTQDDDVGRVRTWIVSRANESQESHLSAENTGTANRATWKSPATGYDPRRRDWYRGAISNEQIIWTDAFESYPVGIPLIVASVDVSTSILQDTVLGMAIDLRQLTTYVSRASIPDGVKVSIIDGSRHVIASSNQAQFNQVLEQTGLPTIEDLVSTAVVRVYDREQERKQTLIHGTSALARPAAAGEYASSDDEVGAATHVHTDSKDSTTRYTRTKGLRLFDDAIKWTLIVTLPKSAVPVTGWYAAFPALITPLALILAVGIAAACLLIRLTRPVFQLHRDATIDHLTGALNRGEFQRRCVQWSASQTVEPSVTSQVVVAILDLDGFKIINDRFGHEAGDAILCAVVERLGAQLPESSLIGRLGGDEFAVVFSVGRHTDNLAQLERIRARTVARPVKTRTGFHRFGMTVGLACLLDGESLLSALTRADSALIAGKQLQKNHCYMAGGASRLHRSLASVSTKIALAAP